MEFRVERDADQVRLITAAMVVSLWLHPFRLDVHRTDGTVVIETAADHDGQYWAYATLNDAFTVRRRCRLEDAIFGLGEKTGRHNRNGRDFVMYNADVLNPYAAAEFIADKAPGDPRGDPTSVDYDPYYVSIPFFYHQTYPDGRMAASFVDNGYRGSYEFSEPSEYRISFRGGQYTEYVFAGPDMPEILDRLHLVDRAELHLPRCGLWGTTNAGGSTTRSRRSKRWPIGTGSTRSRATACGWTSNTWTTTESSPGIPTCFPIHLGCSNASGSRAFG